MAGCGVEDERPMFATLFFSCILGRSRCSRESVDDVFVVRPSPGNCLLTATMEKSKKTADAAPALLPSKQSSQEARAAIQ